MCTRLQKFIRFLAGSAVISLAMVVLILANEAKAQIISFEAEFPDVYPRGSNFRLRSMAGASQQGVVGYFFEKEAIYDSRIMNLNYKIKVDDSDEYTLYARVTHLNHAKGGFYLIVEGQQYDAVTFECEKPGQFQWKRIICIFF